MCQANIPPGSSVHCSCQGHLPPFLLLAMAPKGKGKGSPKGSPQPQMTKAEREALRMQERAEQQMSALEANRVRLDTLKAWATDRLKGLLELDDLNAKETAQYLLTRTDAELHQWEVNFFGGGVGFAEEYIQQREQLKLQPLAPTKKEKDEGDKRRDAAAKVSGRLWPPAIPISVRSARHSGSASSGRGGGLD